MGASRKKVGFIATGILALALTFSDVVNAQQKTRVNDNDPIALFNGASGVELNDPKVLTVEDSARVHSKSGESMGFIILRGKDAGPSAEQLKKYFEVNFKKNGVKAKVFVGQMRGPSSTTKTVLAGVWCTNGNAQCRRPWNMHCRRNKRSRRILQTIVRKV